jgi:hypothetical protein
MHNYPHLGGAVFPDVPCYTKERAGNSEGGCCGGTCCTFKPISLPLSVQPMHRALIPSRIFEQVELVVFLPVPLWSCLDNLGHNLAALRRKMFLLYLLHDALGDFKLLGGGCEDG